jgi:ABC-type multidrug transport system fused ATPase/permease subunit
MSALDAHEHAERAEHAHHAADPFVTRVSITIALLAVAAAIVGSLETVESAQAINATSRSVLAQDKATDAWNEYQADSLKRHLYGLAADQTGPNAARYRQTAADQIQAQKAVRARAQAAGEESERYIRQSEAAERRHHWLTAAAALLEIGIGISSVSIITKVRLFWWGALALGAGGLALFATAWAAG